MEVCGMTKLIMLLNVITSLRVTMSEPVREYRPSDDIAKAELVALKTMLTSVQGSLITSVGLIQGTTYHNYRHIIRNGQSTSQK